jgi:hypothetical protein
MLRLVFYLTKPEFLMKRVATLWRQFNDEGSMELLSMDRQSMQLEVRGVGEPHALFCASITGWCREVVRASGASNPVSKHVSCIARGQMRCVWEVRYGGLDADEAPPSSAPESAPSLAAFPSRPPSTLSRIPAHPSRPPGARESVSPLPAHLPSRPPGSSRGDA